MDSHVIVPKTDVSTIEKRLQGWFHDPSVLSRKPFQVVDHVYYVGNTWVSAFLLDTSMGLVLIDCSIQETLYQLIDGMYQLGFDPHNIKKILLTHGHFDHCGAAGCLQRMSGCEIWVGAGDGDFFTTHRERIAHEERCPEFEVTGYYDYSKPIDLGNFQLEVVHCPGHTPGTSSFFFTAQYEGKTVNCAIHGGLGAGVLRDKELAKVGLPNSLRQDYCNSIEKVINRPVDVVLPSHVGHAVDYDFFGIADGKPGAPKSFIDPTAWKRMLTAKRAEIIKLMEESKS